MCHLEQILYLITDFLPGLLISIEYLLYLSLSPESSINTHALFVSLPNLSSDAVIIFILQVRVLIQKFQDLV